MPSTSATESQSSSFAMPGNVMFNNLHGCTINISPALPPAQSPLMPNIELTENELDELFSQVYALTTCIVATQYSTVCICLHVAHFDYVLMFISDALII